MVQVRALTPGRVALGLVGLAGMGWGAVLLAPLLLGAPADAVSLLGWLVGGPVLHDLLLAPLVAVVGLAVTRLLPAGWRGPVAAGLVLSGALVLVAAPRLWRAEAGPVNPGLNDRDYLPGLLVELAVLWGVLLLTTWLRTRRRGQPRT